MKRHMPKRQWRDLQDIYRLIERNLDLEEEDHEPEAPTSSLPKWKRNVRKVLHYRGKTREIEWDDNRKYRIPA